MRLLVLALVVCASSWADQCGSGTRIPNHSAPCATGCQMLKQVPDVTDPDKCCAICAAVEGTNAWTLQLKNKICHCKIQDIRTVGTHSKVAVSGWLTRLARVRCVAALFTFLCNRFSPTPAPPTPPAPPAPPTPASSVRNLLYIVVDVSTHHRVLALHFVDFTAAEPDARHR